jgi:hypothetical protein
MSADIVMLASRERQQVRPIEASSMELEVVLIERLAKNGFNDERIRSVLRCLTGMRLEATQNIE